MPENKDRIDGNFSDIALLRRPEVSDDLYEKFRSIFLETAPEAAQSLSALTKDRIGLRKAAHKLKGACGFVGAPRLGALASELEFGAETLGPTQIKNLTKHILQTLKETEDAMRGGSRGKG